VKIFFYVFYAFNWAMYYVSAAATWIKYALIQAKAAITGRTVVNFMGGTYSIYGNVVQRIGSYKR
jgi:hypothetical protein